MDRDGKLKCNLNTTCGLTNSCQADFHCQPGNTFALARQYAQVSNLYILSNKVIFSIMCTWTLFYLQDCQTFTKDFVKGGPKEKSFLLTSQFSISIDFCLLSFQTQDWMKFQTLNLFEFYIPITYKQGKLVVIEQFKTRKQLTFWTISLGL